MSRRVKDNGMARFSLGRDDDNEEPSSPQPRPKRQRTFGNVSEQQQQQRRRLQDRRDASGQEDEELDPENGKLVFEHPEDVQVEDDDEEILSNYNSEEREEDEDRNRIVDRAPSSGGRTKDQDLGQSSVDKSLSVVLTDPDVFDCPICLELLTIPVFQCENGHIACSSCCTKVWNKCPSCCLPIGYNRCRGIEMVLESIKIKCQNMKYGCKETVGYNKKHEHEQTCLYSPCSCPLPNCSFVGSSKQLFMHFNHIHPVAAISFSYNNRFHIVFDAERRYLILQEKTDRRLFILNRDIELLGDTVNIDCIGPRSLKREFSYELIVRNEGSSIQLQTFTETRAKRAEHVSELGFLLVPSDFICGQLKLEARIRKHHEVTAGNTQRKENI